MRSMNRWILPIALPAVLLMACDDKREAEQETNARVEQKDGGVKVRVDTPAGNYDVDVRYPRSDER